MVRVVRRGEERERGAVLIMAVLMITPLLTMSAIALDVGNAYQQRRRAQNAVDAASLAAARDLPNLTQAVDVVATVKSFALKNYGTQASDWVGCTDSGMLAIRPDAAANNNRCISVDSRWRRVRVKLPRNNVPTAFARVIGVTNLTVSATAVASLVQRTTSDILPFGLPSAGGDDVYVCLKTGSGGHAPNQPPCDGPDDGNFGSLDIPFHGNSEMGTPTQCTGNTNGRLEVNMALGVDHPLVPYVPGDGIRLDQNQCPVDLPAPNQLPSQTGIGSNLDNGMALSTSIGTTVIPGRLRVTPFETRVARTDQPALDDRPLWAFIDPSLGPPDIPATCVRSTITSKLDMNTCLQDYVDGGYTTAIFTKDDIASDGVYDIERSPRFGWVPELWETQWDNGSGNYEIKAFRPVFLQTLYFGCTANLCDVVFDPGEAGIGIPGAGNNCLQALNAFLTPNSTLPSDIVNRGPQTGGNITAVLTD